MKVIVKLALVVAAVSHGHHHDWRAAVASVYGPGTGDGSSAETACGAHLTAGTVGVASRTLPCGRLLRFRYGRRESYARVIDRGPYVSDRDFDFTNGLRVRLRAPVSVLSVRWSFAPSGGGR